MWNGSSIMADDDRELHPLCGRAIEECFCELDIGEEEIELGELEEF